MQFVNPGNHFIGFLQAFVIVIDDNYIGVT